MSDHATPYSAAIDDGDVQLYHGDVCDVLRSLPAGAAQTCVTSPPYWGLRDYGAAGQIGLEDTPELYVERMVAVFREVWRVLRDDGTLWLNLGDSYASQGGAHGGRDDNQGGVGAARVHAAGAGDQAARSAPPGLKPKDLVGIPWRVAFALQADGWYLRSDVIWAKPNPMPESVTDRPTKAHEYVFLLAKRPRYFYDGDAVREPHTRNWSGAAGLIGDGRSGWAADAGRNDYNGRTAPPQLNPAGRNLRSVWEVATEPFPEAHFATYPQALVRRCILAGTSERGECSECGAPWVRETEAEYVKSPVHGAGSVIGRHQATGANGWDGSGLPRLDKRVTTTGWRPSCSCDDGARTWREPRPQLVLDPFIGSATTALVARKHGRRCIGIDLSADYLKIAAGRLSQLSLLAGDSVWFEVNEPVNTDARGPE